MELIRKCQKERPPHGGLSEFRQLQLSRLARALRQAGASPEGKVRLLLRSARSDLQRRIGDFKRKNLLLGLFKCYRDILHGVDPSSGSLSIVVVIKDAALFSDC
jgi:hypothetical protein